MIKRDIILVGGGGHCISVIETIERTGKYQIAGISDMKERLGESLAGYKVILNDDELPEYINSNTCFLITVGHIKTFVPRMKLFYLLKKLQADVATIIDPNAMVSSLAKVGEGSVVLRNSFINADATVGVNCILNTGSIVEHSSVIGDHVHISTGAIVNGDCRIGNGCFVGSGAIISNGISVCDGVLIGAGSVVLKDIESPGTYMGNPARFIKL